MASNVDWEKVFKGCIPIFKAEEKAFAEAYEICTSNDFLAEKVFDEIRDVKDIPAKLKIIYHEGLYGSLDRAKSRVRHRIGTMKVNYFSERKMPKFGKSTVDSMHALDYTSMDVDSIAKAKAEAMDKDAKLAAELQHHYNKSEKKNRVKSAKKMMEELLRKENLILDDEEDNSNSEDNFGSQNSPALFQDEDEGIEDDVPKNRPPAMCRSAVAEQTSLELHEGPMSKKEKKSKKTREHFSHYVDLENGDIIYSKVSSDDEDYKFINYNEPKAKIYGSSKSRLLLSKRRATATAVRGDTGAVPSTSNDSVEDRFDKVFEEDRKAQKRPSSSASEEEIKQVDHLTKSFEPDAKKPKTEFEKELLSEIRTCSTRMSKASLDHTAYLRGMSELYGVNLNKHRQDVLSELDAESPEKSDPKNGEDVNSKLGCSEPSSEIDNNPGSMDSEHEDELPPLYQNQMSDPELQRKFPEYL